MKALTPRLEVHQPVLTDEDCARLRDIDKLTQGRFKSLVLDITYPVAEGAAGCEAALDRLAAAAEALGRPTATTSSSCPTAPSAAERVAIPALLACAGVHHHLVKKGLRTSTGLVVDSGSVREVHHFALLAGYGAEAICPWLAFATIKDMAGGASPRTRIKNYIKAIGKGLNKVMSKMGISTYQSYCGAQIFEAIGLNSGFVAPLLHRHRDAGRRHRPAGSRRGSGAHAPGRLLERSGAGQHARCRRRIRLPRSRRRPHVDAGCHRQAPARDALRQVRDLQGIRRAHQRPEQAP